MGDEVSLIAGLQDPLAPPEARHRLFAQVVMRFQDMAYGYAYALLGERQAAQDAAQEAFIAAYQHLDQLREPAAFAGWLKRIVHSQCQQALRHERLGALPLEAAETAGLAEAAVAYRADDDPGPAAQAERAELRDTVRGAVLALPERERESVMLYYINGYSQDEVARFLEVPAPTVRKRLQRGRDHLKEALMDMLRDSLADERPSRDERFLQAVQLATTLEEAALESQLAVLEAALVDGLDVNAAGEGGQTLLHWAVRKGHVEAVAMLLRFGADARLADRSGRTPQRLADDLGQTEIAALLRQARPAKR